jgi:branched-chain amino acid transport system permease protein
MLTTALQVCSNGILLGGIYALISMGLTLIFGVMNVVNFAHGEFLMISMYMAFWLYYFLGIHPYVSLVIVIPAMFFIGLLTQKGLIQRLIGAGHFAQIFVTVGLIIALQNGALFFWTADFRGVHTEIGKYALNIGGCLISTSRVLILAVSILVMVGLLVFLKKTYIGRAMRATSQNGRAAWLMGINVNQIYMIAFGIGSLCVGVAGAMLMPVYSVFPTVGSYFVLVAFVVVVLGGMGDIVGAFVAGIIVGLIETIGGYVLAPRLGVLCVFILFVLILLFMPSGIKIKARAKY